MRKYSLFVIPAILLFTTLACTGSGLLDRATPTPTEVVRPNVPAVPGGTEIQAADYPELDQLSERFNEDKQGMISLTWYVSPLNVEDVASFYEQAMAQGWEPIGETGAGALRALSFSAEDRYRANLLIVAGNQTGEEDFRDQTVIMITVTDEDR